MSGYPNTNFLGQFQRQVYPQPAAGVEGDFCDHNPRASVLAGPGGLVAGATGIIVGHFAWFEFSALDPNNAPTIVNPYASVPGTVPAGFVHREQQGLITSWLGGASLMVMPGFPVVLHQAGGFFVRNRGAGYAQLGMKAYANLNDGSVQFAAPGASPGGVSFTGAIAAGTCAGTGTILGNTLSMVTVTTPGYGPGVTVAGAGIPAGCQITKQLSGTPGGVGTYALNFGELSIPTAQAINGTFGILTASAVTGTIGNGALLAGTGVATGSHVAAPITGTGGAGTYVVDNNTVVASTAMTGSGAIETKWFGASAGAPGELIKMSSWLLG